ncbi:hypothetical protein GCM10010286_23650 [Streptomyces toxytricini]|nr:hypothetical protein GCM10010286_23650 [Streptomyces toxytricini]
MQGRLHIRASTADPNRRTDVRTHGRARPLACASIQADGSSFPGGHAVGVTTGFLSAGLYAGSRTPRAASALLDGQLLGDGRPAVAAFLQGGLRGKWRFEESKWMRLT